MKKLILAAAITLAATVATQAQTSTQTPTTQPYENYIQVNGKADRDITPNEIYVRIVLDESDSKGKASLDQQEKDMIVALRKAGIEPNTALTVESMGGKVNSKVQTRANKTFQLKVNSAAQLDDAVDALTSVAVSSIAVTRLSHTDIKKFYSELRGEAMQNAKETAQTLASAVGQSVGRAVFIADYSNETPYFAADSYSARLVKTSAEVYTMDNLPANINYRTYKINYNISVKFELK